MSSTAFVNGSTLSDAGWANDVDTATYNRLTSVSGTNTIVGTGPVSMTAYAAGQYSTFIPAATNTGPATMNVTPSGASALGARNIFSNGVALIGGELKIGVPVIIWDDGTQFNLIGGTPGQLLGRERIQLGASGTATQNFVLGVPSSPDGTIKLARGNDGATTQDIFSVANTTGIVTFNQGVAVIGDITQTGSAFTSYTPNVTADAGTWGAPTITNARYYIFGKLLYLQLNIDCTVSGGSPSEFRVQLPESKTGAATKYLSYVTNSNNSSADSNGFVRQIASQNYITFTRPSGAAWVGACAILWTGCIEIA